MKLLSTRARAKLWRLQSAVQQAAKERERLLRILISSRHVLTGAAQRDATMDFVCADQEYRCTVASLETFVQQHTAMVDPSGEDIGVGEAPLPAK